MRRLARRLFTLCSAVSLLLCAAVCVVWARPGLLPGEWPGVSERVLYVHDGDAVLMADRSWPDLEDLADERWGDDFEHKWLGFGTGGLGFRRWHDDGVSSFGYMRWWRVPLWCPAALLALPPLAIGAGCVSTARRRRSRRWAGQCPSCGYDLRATPARCPECGTAAAAANSEAPAAPPG